MRPDIVALLRSSDRAFVRQLIGNDPVAMFRWGILRATIRGMAAFNQAGRRWAAKTAGMEQWGRSQQAGLSIEEDQMFSLKCIFIHLLVHLSVKRKRKK